VTESSLTLTGTLSNGKYVVTQSNLVAALNAVQVDAGHALVGVKVSVDVDGTGTAAQPVHISQGLPSGYTHTPSGGGTPMAAYANGNLEVSIGNGGMLSESATYMFKALVDSTPSNTGDQGTSVTESSLTLTGTLSNGKYVVAAADVLSALSALTPPTGHGVVGVRVSVDADGSGTTAQPVVLNLGLPSGLYLGGNGNDQLTGSSGNDVFMAGPGSDQMTGGSGADRFVFKPGDTPVLSDVDPAAPLPSAYQLAAGVDLIKDFGTGDKIDLSGLQLDTDLSNGLADSRFAIIRGSFDAQNKAFTAGDANSPAAMVIYDGNPAVGDVSVSAILLASGQAIPTLLTDSNTPGVITA
jgi:Ca2+-binding RTX toxin-like protein